MLKRNLTGILILAAGLAIGLSPARAQEALVKIERIQPEEISFTGFVLDNPQEITIEAIGAHRHSRHWIASNAWILNADTREMVWELTDANSKWKSRKLREYRDAVTLPAGRYEVYYGFFPEYQYEGGWSISKFFFGDRTKYDDESYQEFTIAVYGKGKPLDRAAVGNYQKQVKEKAAVALNADRDDLYLNQGFKLDQPLELTIYAVGEARPDGAYDYGWILNSETRQQVWKFGHRNSEYAGGSEKNRMARETLTLPAGNYVAFFVTDDSHSPIEWNAAPPYDPSFWGIYIFAKDESQKKGVRLFDYQDIPSKNVIFEFTRLGDDEFITKGFTLKKDMDIRIYALGEGRDGDLFDYGWIVEAKTHRRAWEMRYEDTEHAGGNSKNRLYDRVIPLQKGSYILHFITDDSHSYRDWNASPPFDQQKWGITLIAAGDKFDPKDVADYREEADASILARIVRVGDSENREVSFTLEKDGDVRIYALGEGRDGNMFDYGWIEDTNGKIAWEMTYRKTTHAGGGVKNRMFDDTVFLKAGKYTVHYESDDSHSYRDWNDDPPRDPINWGITVYKLSD